MNCCDQPMQLQPFNKRYDILFCTRCRHYIPVAKELPKEGRTWRHTYTDELERGRRNYFFLRSHGFSGAFAGMYKSNKRTARIKKMLKRGLSVEFIQKSMEGK